MAKKEKKNKKTCTYIGGQAVLEGVMMMGKSCMATAVRDPDGEVQLETKRLNRNKHLSRVMKIPFLRGIVNLVLSLVRGTKTLMRSAAVYGDSDEEEAGRFQKWLAEKFKVSLMDVVSFISALLGVALAVAIFIVIPQVLVNQLGKWFPGTFGNDVQLSGLWSGLVLGGIKFIIFLAYLSLILLMKDIRRLYMYHGAEHKTINAYERGVELVPEKVKECSRIHDRCGTSFLFIVLFINIAVISVVNWAVFAYVPVINGVTNGVLTVLIKIAIEIILLPFIAGFSYEILKFFAKFDNKFVDIFKAPGKLLQKALTTREPNEEMLEVAIAAFKKVLEMDADASVPEQEFVTGGVLSKKLAATKAKFTENGIDESDAEWIYSLALGIKRSELSGEGRTVKPSEAKRIKAIVDERLTGRPLWYIIGDTDFYGCKIKVDERVLIPRPETELLADYAVKSIEDGDKVLDMCTGSGCIAVSVAKNCQGRGITVTAADVSDAAIMLARENAKLNGVSVDFVQSDLFTNVRGRFNVIICNPPYIKSGEIPELQKEVKEHEPKIALDGGTDGLDFYRRLAKSVRSYLARDGVLLLECGEGQTEEILKLFEKRDYAMVMKDLSGVERFLKIAF